MKKIGVISLYYKNNNYGGLLQAYALVYAIKKFGYDSEQICFDFTCSEKVFKQTFFDKIKTDPFGLIYRHTLGKLLKSSPVKDLDFSKNIGVRVNCFKRFADNIPHSKIYGKDIADSNSVYDCFICGSDQIWNPSYLYNEYLLDFVKDKKKKISYAASIGKDILNDKEKKYINEKIFDFFAVSVRESSSQKLIDIRNDVSVVLDPTLLLDREEWDSIIYDYNIPDKYIFSYFLGDSKKQKEIVKKFAKENNLKIVTFPHILGSYLKNDMNFGDYLIYDADPLQFISLIKNAEYIFTDSFHACVFSNIYEKKYVVFERHFKNKKEKMSSRIISLLEMFEQMYRLVDTNDFSSEIVKKDNNALSSEEYKYRKEKSMNFLNESITKSLGL